MILARILALVVGYFFGTFQTGYFYGKAHGIDVREHGSGNSEKTFITSFASSRYASLC